MARMFPAPIPSTVVSDPFRAAERRVYEALAATLPKRVAVFYGAAWLGRSNGRAPVDGEADFIVADPDAGLLVLEVKGGGIARDGTTGQWVSRDRFGRVHPIKDPLDQAVTSKHTLLRKLRDLRGVPSWINAGHGVVLPDCRRSRGLLGPAAPSEIFAFADDMGRLGERTREMIEYWASGRAGSGPGAEGLEALVRYFAPTFELAVPAGPSLDEDDRAICRLTEEQFSALDLLSRMRRVAVTGGAGTGKTLLAREKALRLAREGFRTLLTCRSGPLAAYLAQSCAGCENLTVASFSQLCLEVSARAGVPVAAAGPKEPSDARLRRELPEALLEALVRSPEERFDAILVDEGQDFPEECWSVLQLALHDESRGILYVFYDDNQRIYATCSPFLESLPAVSLTKNVRNAKPIYDLASPYFACGKLTPAGPEGRPVVFVPAEPGAAEREVGRVLHRLIREELVQPGQIAVLTGEPPERSALSRAGRLGAFECTPELDPRKVLVDSVRHFKGLERPVVVLAELEGALHSPELLYVALTRARVHLVIVGTPIVLKAIQGGAGARQECLLCSA
jgi:hypothetical protein